MSRPNSISDLDIYERGDVTLATVSREIVDISPTAAARIYSAFALIADADPEELGFTAMVVDGNLVRTKTTAELNRALDRAQATWDRGKEEYQTWRATGELPKYDYAMMAYCRAEGIEFPQKQAI